MARKIKKKKEYNFEAWIHPKNGGDDKFIDGTVHSTSLEGAKNFLEKWLSKRSAITTDYRILED